LVDLKAKLLVDLYAKLWADLNARFFSAEFFSQSKHISSADLLRFGGPQSTNLCNILIINVVREIQYMFLINTKPFSG
jgi:hypothetical protein